MRGITSITILSLVLLLYTKYFTNVKYGRIDFEQRSHTMLKRNYYDNKESVITYIKIDDNKLFQIMPSTVK